MRFTRCVVDLHRLGLGDRVRFTRRIVDFHRLGLTDRMYNGFLVEQVVAVRLFVISHLVGGESNETTRKILMANHTIVVIKIEGRERCKIKGDWFDLFGLRGVDHIRDH